MSDKAKKRTRELMAMTGWSYQACLNLQAQHPGKSLDELAVIAKNVSTIQGSR
jgi:hypothetical protein